MVLAEKQAAVKVKIFVFFLFIFSANMLVFADTRGEPRLEGCLACHKDLQQMTELGRPQFVMDPAAVRAQTQMSAACEDCHLGNPAGKTVREAHRGMLTLSVIDGKFNSFLRRDLPMAALSSWPNLGPRGQNRATLLAPKIIRNGKIDDNRQYRTILWHDRNSSTLAFNPVIAAKTCGRCHAEIVESYLRSPMGGGKGAHTQSQYRIWTGATGPQSCGLWIGALSRPAQDAFTDENIKIYDRHSTMPIDEKAAFNNQRVCNNCHTGCLDCHLDVQKSDPANPAKGPHAFIRKPKALACYGGGRSFACHAGPLERRRGDGYIRAEFTRAAPEGKKILEQNPDVHMSSGVECVDCHRPNKITGFHADLKRNVDSADCSACHKEVVKAYSRGPHKKVDCAACHLKVIGGYAFNFWSAVGPKGHENPLTRIQDYYISASRPLIIKNPGGVWIPVHVVPHAAGNVRAEEVKISDRLLFRRRPDSDVDRLYPSNDSYAVTGLARAVDDKDHDTMLWLNLDRVAHGLGKARPCEDCHGTNSQTIMVKFSGGSYKDVEDGEYEIQADNRGLRVTGFRGAGGKPAPQGLTPFADKWALKGDFSLPPIRNRKLYEGVKLNYDKGTFTH